jgi:hypothetical protein
VEYQEWQWIRAETKNIPKDNIDSHSYAIIPNTQNRHEYSLASEDVGFYITVILKSKGAKQYTRAEGVIGPILPGPPRLLDFEVAGELAVGGYARAEGRYIGGLEGPSEYWWMKVTADGKRIQINDPKPIPVVKGLAKDLNGTDISNDPRYYKITSGSYYYMHKSTALIFDSLIFR